MSAAKPPEATPAEALSPEQQRGRALALLLAAHKFPVHYDVSVIALSADDVHTNLRIAVSVDLDYVLADEHHVTIPSKSGRYTTHRFRILCITPEAVLDLYARIRTVEGVMTVL